MIIKIIIFFIFINYTFLQNNWHNLKIKLETSCFEKEAKKLGVQSNIVELIKDNILHIIKDYIYITFKVKEKQEIELDYYYMKSKYDLEKFFGDVLKGYDLVIKITAISKDTHVLAQALPLGFNIDSNRPNIGVVMINTYYLKNINETRKNFNKHLITILHEVFHIIGFNNIGLANLNQNYSLDGLNNDYKIFSPNVLKYGKKQYGCADLKSLFFENNLSNHWEATQFGSEIEMATSKRNLKISEITLAFFEDLGWYKVNYNMSEILPFGLKKGCEFINKPSTKFEEFFDKEDVGCSNDYISEAKYFKTIFSNDLYIKNNISLCGLNNKKNTSCLKIIKLNNNKTTCAKSKCLIKNDKLFVMFSYNNTNFFCKKDEEIIEKNGIKIECPKIDRFCEYKFECKNNNCNSRGFCLNGECICNKKYKGFGCEFDYDENINHYELNKKCNFNGYFKNKKCNCYENYEGMNCEYIKINKGSFGTKCKDSIYLKCYKGDYYKFINKKYIKNDNFDELIKNKLISNNTIKEKLQKNNAFILFSKLKLKYFNLIKLIDNNLNLVPKKKVKLLINKKNQFHIDAMKINEDYKNLNIDETKYNNQKKLIPFIKKLQTKYSELLIYYRTTNKEIFEIVYLKMNNFKKKLSKLENNLN